MSLPRAVPLSSGQSSNPIRCGSGYWGSWGRCPLPVCQAPRSLGCVRSALCRCSVKERTEEERAFFQDGVLGLSSVAGPFAGAWDNLQLLSPPFFRTSEFSFCLTWEDEGMPGSSGAGGSRGEGRNQAGGSPAPGPAPEGRQAGTSGVAKPGGASLLVLGAGLLSVFQGRSDDPTWGRTSLR